MSDVVCPQCGNVYAGIASHWAQSSTCSYPNTPQEVIEIVYGCLSIKGHLHTRQKRGRRNKVVFSSTNKEKMDKLKDVFGVYSNKMSKTTRVKESRFSNNDIELTMYSLSLIPIKEIQERPDYDSYTPSDLFFKSALHMNARYMGGTAYLRISENNQHFPHEIFKPLFKSRYIEEREDRNFIIYSTKEKLLQPILDTPWPTGWWNDSLRCDNASALR